MPNHSFLSDFYDLVTLVRNFVKKHNKTNKRKKDIEFHRRLNEITIPIPKTLKKDASEQEKLAHKLVYDKSLTRAERARANEKLNRLQQEDAGVKFFEWSTANDERVSPEHKRLEGKIYKWNDPAHYPIIDTHGTRGTPAQRENCRCTALPVILCKDYKVKAIKDKDGSIHYKIIKGRL